MLQSRFAALSHVVANSGFYFAFSCDLFTGNYRVPVADCFILGPKRHSSNSPTTPAGRLGKGQSEMLLDQHTPPHGDEDAARKRQKGLQDVPEFALGDKFLPSVQGSE